MFTEFPKRGALALAVCAGIAVPAAPVLAEGSRLQPDFTFRRVTAPPAGSAPRITVQASSSPWRQPPPSAPSAEEEAGTRASAALPAPRSPGSAYAWFWDIVPADLAATGPGRLDQGLRALQNGPGGASVAAPRLDTMRRIADTHGRDILMATIGTEVSPALVLAVISIESAGRTEALSSAGAQGLMQLMPATAERFGVADRTVAADNIKGGTAYLHWLLDHFQGDPILALAAYNAGEGAVRDNGGVPDYAETRDYVPKVLAAWNVARGLCQTPPLLVSDGCVFNTGGS